METEKMSVFLIGTAFELPWKMGVHTFLRKRSRYLRRVSYLVLVAVMIGISNVVMEEDRSPNDTRARIEQGVIQSDEEE